ncbi:RagB/SusD family nutrient uptake outer membrane protein [Longitalea luteola]|uniref:RagB/SusD family nutrient uptake outer membrane protein n=1 Tax=Longitalea luteola TaxID=2812563 RepID=UPI001A97836A|nr:RagB/SusD family nutrient uptake outer membrane protein [Longitalea luteola]
MKKLKNLSYAVAAFLVTSATSCKKQLEEFNPHSATAENMWNTPAGFSSLVNSAYQELHLFYGQEDGMWLLEGGTDLWYSAGRSGYARQIVYYEALAPTQSQPTKAWTSCYKSINLCNAGIGRIDEANFTNETDKNQRLGELHFLRALYYYHLVEQFGSVILNTKEAAEGVDLYPTRSKPEDVYDVMISDLEFAKNNLPVSWPVGEYSRASKKSAMGLLAKVLLTRAYYSTGADAQAWFTKAKDAALEVINNKAALGNLDLYQNVAEVGSSVYGPAADRAKNKEALFVLSYDQTNANLNALTGANGNRIFKYTLTRYTGKGAMNSTPVNAYGVDGEGRLMPTWHMLDLFDETKDARYNTWFQEVWIANQNYTWKVADTSSTTLERDPSLVGTTLAAGDTAMWCTKGVLPFNRKTKRYLAVGRNDLYVNPQHKQGAAIVENKATATLYPSFKKFVNANRTFSGTTDFGDAMIMRLSEMYLIAAEAFVKLNDQVNAAKYVNEIRKRAALPGQAAAMEVAPGDVTIDFILDERGREFAGELQRWYDLKRVFQNGTDWVGYIKKWNPDQTLVQPYHRLRPIPQNELSALLNAKEFGQNEGYPQP